MDYDDRFHPSEGNDFDDNEKDLLKFSIQNLKSLDKNYHKYKKEITVKDENGFYIGEKKITIEYYSSGQIGSRIRNALTGQYTKDIVGSKFEDLYFKITLTEGNALTLFYDSPEQYERHHHEKLPTNIKEKWIKKRLLFEKTMY